MTIHPVDTLPLDLSLKENQELLQLLYRIIGDVNQIILLARQAGVDLGDLNLGQGPKIIWSQLLIVSRQQENLRKFLKFIASDIKALEKPIHQYLLESPGAKNTSTNTDTTSSPGTIASDMKSIKQLADALLACQNFEDKNTRNVIVEGLRSSIRGSIRRHAADFPDTVNIIKTCRNYDGGIEELVRQLELYENDSDSIKEVLRLTGLSAAL